MGRFAVVYKVDKRRADGKARWSQAVHNARGKAGVYVIREPSRAEPSRAEPSRAEPSRAEPSVLYVGRSFVDLGRTFQRHFFVWGESYVDGEPMGKHRVLFERDRVEARFEIVARRNGESPDDHRARVASLEARTIQRLRPTLNTRCEFAALEEEIPF